MPRHSDGGAISWLLDVPELYSRRAPGNTCLSALHDAKDRKPLGDYIKNPRNDSKGCGGIMRVAPLALYYSHVPITELDKEAAYLSAITHGHPLGYMPSAVLVHIINRIIYDKKSNHNLTEIICEAMDTVCGIFKNKEHVGELYDIINKAVILAGKNEPDSVNIEQLGEGWVAEETLAIALYYALRYEHDFDKGVMAAVNHDGDSDSTGAVAGNILGAINGFDAIDDRWKANLELYDVIIEMADDLCYGCMMSYDPTWDRKYIHMRRSGTAAH